MGSSTVVMSGDQCAQHALDFSQCKQHMFWTDQLQGPFFEG